MRIHYRSDASRGVSVRCHLPNAMALEMSFHLFVVPSVLRLITDEDTMDVPEVVNNADDIVDAIRTTFWNGGDYWTALCEGNTIGGASGPVDRSVLGPTEGSTHK